MMQDSDSETEIHPVFDAIENNDLDKVKLLINSDKSLIEKKEDGQWFLMLAFEAKRWEIFEYLLQQNIDLDVLHDDDVPRDSILMKIIGGEERYLLAVIKSGANINYRDVEGNTFLHYAIDDCSTKCGQAAIEKGADINADNNLGETPLFIACKHDNIDWVHMLLYYGAIATIPTHKGRLPLTVAKEEELLTLLFDHTFDDGLVIIPLASLLDDIARKSFLVDLVSEVVYDFEDLAYLEDKLGPIQMDGLRILFAKFRWIIRDFVNFCNPWQNILKEYRHWHFRTNLKGVVIIFLESEFAEECVRKLPEKQPLLAYLIREMTDICGLELEEITEIACILLSYGAELASCDLDMVYECYGFCELFKILLHMDTFQLDCWEEERSLTLAILYYEIDKDLDELLNKLPITVELLEYFNRQSLKEKDIVVNKLWCEDMRKEEYSKIQAKLKSLPTVPLLIELSRDAARKFIINRNKVKNSKQFYTILNWLPIDKYTRQIIGLEKKLY